MPSRNTIEIDTGLEVKVPAGYCMKFDLVDALSQAGLALLKGQGVTEGPVKLTLVNNGRNIVTLVEGSPFAEARLERITKLEWE